MHWTSSGESTDICTFTALAPQLALWGQSISGKVQLKMGDDVVDHVRHLTHTHYYCCDLFLKCFILEHPSQFKLISTAFIRMSMVLVLFWFCSPPQQCVCDTRKDESRLSSFLVTFNDWKSTWNGLAALRIPGGQTLQILLEIWVIIFYIHLSWSPFDASLCCFLQGRDSQGLNAMDVCTAHQQHRMHNEWMIGETSLRWIQRNFDSVEETVKGPVFII